MRSFLNHAQCAERVLSGALLLLLLLAPAQSFAVYEIYTPDMQDSFESSQEVSASCSNIGYFVTPPIYNRGSCVVCQASIKTARKQVEDYPDLVGHTRQAEQRTGTLNRTYAISSFLSQFNTILNSGNVQASGSNGELQKLNDAGTLQDHAKSCVKAVLCDGNIAPEDFAAGRKEKAACTSLQDGAKLVMDEKGTNSGTMSNLSAQDATNDLGLGDGPAGGTIVADPIKAMAAAASSMANGAGAVAAAAGSAGAAAGLAATQNSATNDGGTLLPGSFGAAQGQAGNNFNPAWGTVGGTRVGGGKPLAALNSRFDGYSNHAANGGEKASDRGTDQGGSSDGASRRAARSRSDSGDGLAPAAPGIISEKGHAYSDPWMAYVSGDSNRQLVERLKENPKLRKELRDKISAMLAEEAAQPGGSSGRAERLEYFRAALAEAEKLALQGSLKALAPLDSQEVFTMDAAETKREVQRMLAAIEAPEGDDSPYSLFPRVHRALWRQLGAGKLRLIKTAR